MTLPETGLGALTAQDHEDHHLTLHDLMNRLLVDADKPGDTLMKTTAGTTPASIGAAQPHFCYSNQVKTVNHTVAGALTIAADRDTRAIKIVASANITSLTVNGLELVGDGFSQIWVRVEAGAAITVDLSGANYDVVGTAPTSLANGEAVQFLVQRWNT